ncbi:MAG: hypothetical protein H0T65_00295, partial [Deltaproteobacteria bacterium]|nr:hypothetical protein [Deltaproteobacteria bacterium]
GTRRFALRVDDRWYDATAGKLVENPALGAALAKEAPTDVFLGATPVAVSGEEHHEKHVRFTPAREELTVLGVATKIEATRDGLEVWAYTHELEKNLALVRGGTISYPKPFARVGPMPESMSPVSAKLCERPHVADVAASDRAVFALVTECSPLAPLRLAEYANEAAEPKETQLATRRDLGISFEKLVVSRTGRVHVVGVRDKRLAIDTLVDGKLAASTFAPVSRVFSAVAADDEAVWTLVIDTAGKAAILRDGMQMATKAAPSGLAVDETLGVVVLAGSQLYAERPGPRVVITR